MNKDKHVSRRSFTAEIKISLYFVRSDMNTVGVGMAAPISLQTRIYLCGRNTKILQHLNTSHHMCLCDIIRTDWQLDSDCVSKTETWWFFLLWYELRVCKRSKEVNSERRINVWIVSWITHTMFVKSPKCQLGVIKVRWSEMLWREVEPIRNQSEFNKNIMSERTDTHASVSTVTAATHTLSHARLSPLTHRIHTAAAVSHRTGVYSCIHRTIFIIII